MTENFDILKSCPLFSGVEFDRIPAMLKCLGAQRLEFKKGDTVLAEGDPARYLGIVLSGRAQVIRMDYYGNRSILTSVAPSQIFGESFACAGLSSLPVTVAAVEDSSLLLLDAQRITQTSATPARFTAASFSTFSILLRGKTLFLTASLRSHQSAALAKS